MAASVLAPTRPAAPPTRAPASATDEGIPTWTTAVLVGVALGTVTFLASKRYDGDFAIDHLEAVVHLGDVILARPARSTTLPAYRIGVEQWRGTHWVATPGIDNASASRAGDTASTGRRWLFSPVSFRLSFPGYRTCPATGPTAVRPWAHGVTNIRCLERR
jgi:hypothetical protein